LAPKRAPAVLDRNASGSVVALAELPGVDAVFAATMRMQSAHVRSAKGGLIVRRPGRGATGPLIGLGDLEMGRLIAPSLSTIRVNGDAIGRTAAKLILAREGRVISISDLSSSFAIAAKPRTGPAISTSKALRSAG